MRLYLLRHGRAVEKEEFKGEDADRPLSKKGQKRTRAVIEQLTDHKVAPDVILTSPFKRAVETADICKEVLKAPVKKIAALASGVKPSEAADVLGPLSKEHERIMVVGHEPDLSKFAAWLSNQSDDDFEFKKAGCCCLSGKPRKGGMLLKWMLSPKDLDV
ncbi:MAG TPA: phosphohistidine phosphatase SixA [Planctomycetota bacterium]|nr:phosphohistidine phosphatase SixA [Planctomycetota bacterium]